MSHPFNNSSGKNGEARLREPFRKLAHSTSEAVGSPWAFIIAVLVIVGWAITGPIYHFSDTWQLIINTGTTIVTFLMVFMIQNTQNRDAHAIHLKLDEIIRASKGARNQLMDLENCTEEELQQIDAQFKLIRAKAANARDQAEQTNSDVANELDDIHQTVEHAEKTVRDVRQQRK
jgi:low affinity Fe/Cu permease